MAAAKVPFDVPEGATAITTDAWRDAAGAWQLWGVDKTKVTAVSLPSTLIEIRDYGKSSNLSAPPRTAAEVFVQSDQRRWSPQCT